MTCSELVLVVDQFGTQAIFRNLNSLFNSIFHKVHEFDIRISRDRDDFFKILPLLASVKSRNLTVLTGTSVDSCNWHEVWEFSVKYSSDVIAWVESWQNLDLRFSNVPSQILSRMNIFVVDEYVKREMINISFCAKMLHVVGHPIVRSSVLSSALLRSKFQPTPSSVAWSGSVYYVSEPVTYCYEIYSPDVLTSFQKDKLHQLFNWCELVSIPLLNVMLHPREQVLHFDEMCGLVDEFGCDLELTLAPNSNAVSSDDIIIGQTSMKLLELSFVCPYVFTLCDVSSDVNYDASFLKAYPGLVGYLDAAMSFPLLLSKAYDAFCSRQLDADFFLHGKYRGGYIKIL